MEVKVLLYIYIFMANNFTHGGNNHLPCSEIIFHSRNGGQSRDNKMAEVKLC
jgi:hypothetical protein